MLIGFSFVEAQIKIDDSNVKYKRVDWYIVLEQSKESISDSYQTIILTEKQRYKYKSEEPIRQDKTDLSNPIQMSGGLTFIDSGNALTYYTKIITTLKSQDVIYAKIYYLDNSHHWSDDKIQPDVILAQTTLGDVNEIPDSIR